MPKTFWPDNFVGKVTKAIEGAGFEVHLAANPLEVAARRACEPMKGLQFPTLLRSGHRPQRTRRPPY